MAPNQSPRVLQKDFVQSQRKRIEERIHRYNSVETAKEQFADLGELTPYQEYKIGIVTPLLREMLRRIDNGTYGICIICQGEIDIKRLELVPAAFACVGCDDKREQLH